MRDLLEFLQWCCVVGLLVTIVYLCHLQDVETARCTSELQRATTAADSIHFVVDGCLRTVPQ
jgi:hypothetical protein